MVSQSTRNQSELQSLSREAQQRGARWRTSELRATATHYWLLKWCRFVRDSGETDGLRASSSAIRCDALHNIERANAVLLLMLEDLEVVGCESALVSASAAACDVRTCVEAVSRSEPSGALQRPHQYACRSTCHSSARRI